LKITPACAILDHTNQTWEVRVQQGNNVFRLVGFLPGATLISLTNGFAKKTQKTPAEEIRLAEARKQDYFDRVSGNDE
jgi:phage-related protein